MSLPKYTSKSVPVSEAQFNGGLNSTGGPLSLKDNESSDLQNVDFDKFGSILKRNGYTALNTTRQTSAAICDGLYWFEYDNAGTTTRKAIFVGNTAVSYMSDLDGSWRDATYHTMTITSGNAMDFATFGDTSCIMTNGVDLPIQWGGSGTANVMLQSQQIGITDSRYVCEFNNYLFFGNVQVSGTWHKSRVYWSWIKNENTWNALDFIDVGKNDGQGIQRLKVLGDRLVVYKERSIYNLFFTGDADVPFILPGGGRSNSHVGCVAPFSVQAVDNGHVFLSTDGLYFYDGLNSYKLSDKISATLLGLNKTRFTKACSLVQNTKHRYWLGLSSSSVSEHDRVIVWDWYNNAFTVYVGLSPSAMATFFSEGTDERPYFGDFSGYAYRGDYGDDDYPLNVQTAISAYYYTNWRTYGSAVDKKGVHSAYIYHTYEDTVLTFAYSFDFETADTYSHRIDLSTSGDLWGAATWGSAKWAGLGGAIKRVDLTGRGRVVRFKFANSTIGEPFRIDGFGTLPYLETYV